MDDLPDAGGGAEAGGSLDGPADRSAPLDLAIEVGAPIVTDGPPLRTDGPPLRTDGPPLSQDGPPADGPMMCGYPFVTEGPDLGMPTCPPVKPEEGALCKHPGGSGICGFANGCDLDDWRCVAGAWERTPGRSCTACPDQRPKNGDACYMKSRISFTCTWPSETGAGYSYGNCYNCRWLIGSTINVAGCPATLPAPGSPCPAPQPSQACRYTSTCHNVDRAECNNGVWVVTPGVCN